jgi:hypothetical protein
MRRARQEVPFSQLLFATHATKEYLWEYLRQEELLESEDLIGAIELLRAIERFFGQSLYFAAVSYESAKRNEAQDELLAHSRYCECHP